ncbi:exosortase-dependent surface protein XDP2 [Nostoc sp. NIES-2111]
MIAKKFLFSTGLALSAVVGVSSTAQAATFTTNLSVNNSPKGDVILKSITQNGKEFGFGTGLFSVTAVDILQNTPLGDPVSPPGGAGADAGDLATKPSLNLDNLGTDAASDTKATQYLGTTNLNNIIDTEDTGSFKMNVSFEKAINRSTTGFDNLFFWERGGNSRIRVQALDSSGGTIGNAVTLGPTWDNAGFSIDTLEIDRSQPVGSLGVSFADLGLDALGITSIAGVQLSADGPAFVGPDFKLVAGELIVATPTPEPTTILGLGSIAALALIRRRQAKKSSSF